VPVTYTGFEWDPRKNARNLCERGIDFDLATHVFDDNYFEYREERIEYGEDRYVVIGSVERTGLPLILFVVWTPRFPNRRIISARMANSDEKEEYRKFRG
jgi:hypothetical protein